MNFVCLQLIDELVSYDKPARGSYMQLWRLSETRFEYNFYSSTGFGIDANSTFKVSPAIRFYYIFPMFATQ